VDFKNTGSILAQKGNLNLADSNAISKQTAFQKCWAARRLLSMEAVAGIQEFNMVATIKTAIKTPRSLHLKAKDHVSYVIYLTTYFICYQVQCTKILLGRVCLSIRMDGTSLKENSCKIREIFVCLSHTRTIFSKRNLVRFLLRSVLK
jgi:hypothetical protein